MAFIAAAVAVVGTVLSISGQRSAEKKRRAALVRRAIQLEERADTAIAASQRDVIVQRRNTDLVASRALALTAFQGGDVSDPGIVDLIADIEGEGAYRESVALYQGEQQAYDLRQQAQTLRSGSEDIGDASGINTAATLLQGASSAYSAYASANPRVSGPASTTRRRSSSSGTGFDFNSFGFQSFGGR